MTQKTNQLTLWQKAKRQWKTNPLFSTALVLILMIILQTLALGFEFESFGAWFSHWSRNWINILRNNATVGIVALGMCFVIISGGIDLAVGSTLVAVGATLMFFINGYPTGLLTAAGITGVPAFAIGILACIAMGCALGGVSGFLTQPVLSREALDNLKRAREVLRGKILGGVYPVVSHRNACFLNNEISGMHVCDEIVRRYEGLSREESEDLAVRICAAVARAIEPWVDGFYLMTPFQRVGLMSRILQEIHKM